ncbi:hypothetical protein ACWDA9_19800 [Streptomyces sp. NPDC001193]
MGVEADRVERGVDLDVRDQLPSPEDLGDLVEAAKLGRADIAAVAEELRALIQEPQTASS